METTTTDPDQKKILWLYAAFGVSLIFSFIPNMIAGLICLALGLGVLIMAYAWRSDATQGSLLENHMTYIIRTIWVGSFLALITLAVAAIYLFKALDNTPLEPCINDLLGFMSLGDFSAIETLETQIGDKCLTPYLAKNFTPLVTSAIIGIGPVVIYFLFRFLRGYTRARNGYRLAKPRAWF